MNDETPFTAHGDEPVEARIVSWVLGEASAFEVAELERLCEERPELMVFKRRMAALHGLVTEAEKPRFNHAWKLPAGKRRPLDEIIGEEPPVRVDVEKEKRIRHSGRRAFLAIAACLILTVVVAGLMAPMTLKQSRKSDVAEARSMARQREMAAMEEQEMSEGMQALRTVLPQERIEGTPKPIVLPGQTPSKEKAQRDAPAANYHMAADAMMEKKVRTESDSKPSAPSSSMSKVISATTSAIEIPTPDVDMATPSLDFGDGKDFGTGWGGADGGSGGGQANAPAAEGERSTDAPIVPGSTSVLADTREGGLKKDLATLEENKKRATGYWIEDESAKAEIRGKNLPANRGMIADRREVTEEASGGRGPNPSAAPEPMPNNPAGPESYSELAKREMIRRGNKAGEGDDVLYTDPDPFSQGRGESDGKMLETSITGTAVAAQSPSAGEKAGYDRAASDDTRADRFSQVDSAPELATPAESGAKDNFDGFVNYGSPIQESSKLSDSETDRDDVSKPSDHIVGFTGESNEADGDKASAWKKVSIDGGVFAASSPSQTESELKLPAIRGRIVDKREVAQEDAKKRTKAKPDPPKVDLTKLMEEIAASEDPYSTFSLNISDASFQIAQAALAKGERPDPAGIKVEQFYNAVNYGDPAPAAGQPVSCVIEQAAHPVIPGRNLVRVALKTAAAGRSAAQPLRLTLLVDQSGSMSRADRREAMDAAMRSLGTLLTDKDLVTVIGFSRTSRLLAVDMKGSEVGEKLADIVNQSASEGGTNLEDAIKLAEEKAMRQKLVGAQNRIVLFTDGAANLGDADPQRLAAKVEQLRQQGIAFDIAGIAADDLNDELLAELARKGNGRYSVVGKGDNQNFAKQLAGSFRPAAENVKVQVRFNPERVARYKLIGFEKDRLKTEDFRNDAVDAAELAAEEAGVAIYQVEPLAEGRGEIGEVSVRFRNTASGEMVERMWTMAHDAATPGVGRATPSMQLAVLAMLAGEKLKGGPLADAIDFKQFAEPQAIVKQAFGQDTRVAEMLRMVDVLK